MVYLDYAATCPVVKYPQLLYTKLYCDTAGRECFLNPNANYAYKEKHLLSEAENRVKKAIGVKSGKVVFGGTSSQLIENLTYVLDKLAYTDTEKDYQFLWSPYEHDSLERFNDCDDFYVNNLTDICMKSEDCYVDSVKPIVCWMGCNNITGELFPIVDIGKTCMNNDAFYICDATAFVGHAQIPDDIDKWCSAFVIDGHKLGTELGIGCCWISDELDEWLDDFKLHGTPNLAGALALTQAVENACDNCKLGQNIIYYGELLDHMIDGLIEKDIDFQLIPEYEDNEPSNKFALAINAIRLPGFNARALQSYLASKGIYIGLGQSSCADEADRRILCQGYGLSEQEADEVIRISFGEDSNVEDVKALVDGIIAFRKEYL